MPFQETTRMQARQKLAYMVLQEGLSVSEAARRTEVSRPTAHLWVQRAKEEGIGGLAERSKRPHRYGRVTEAAVQERILRGKAQRPHEGAKKIVSREWPQGEAPICVRTADRILSRSGLTKQQKAVSTGKERFEREACNQMWQLDLKGLPRKVPYVPLSVVDDHSRFCILLSAIEGKSPKVIFPALWEAFQEMGLPDEVLSDNGDGFNDWQAKGPTWFEAKLWLLGIKTPHGRPRHPQTQGKVERFHRTMKDTLRDELCQKTLEAAQAQFQAFREDYNWKRPHEAIGLKPPGAVYTQSTRRCPDVMPAHYIKEGAQSRKVDINGRFFYKGNTYLAGKGLTGEHVEIVEHDNNDACSFAGVPFATLPALKV